jgi:hypothetical protein
VQSIAFRPTRPEQTPKIFPLAQTLRHHPGFFGVFASAVDLFSASIINAGTAVI